MSYPTAPRILSFSKLTGWYEAPIPYGAGYTGDGVPVPVDFTGWTTEGGIYSGADLLVDMSATTPLVDGTLNIAVPATDVDELDPGQYSLALRFIDPTGYVFPALAAVVQVTNP